MALIIFFGYCMMMGVTFGAFLNKVAKPKFRYSSDEVPSSCFAALFWPAVIPALLGYFIFHALGGTNKRQSRDEKRRAKEIAEANHKKELARIAMEEDAMLTRQLAAIKSRSA